MNTNLAGSVSKWAKPHASQQLAWLDNAHRKLDAAVFAAYGWESEMSDEQILEKLLALNLAM